MKSRHTFTSKPKICTPPATLAIQQPVDLMSPLLSAFKEQTCLQKTFNAQKTFHATVFRQIPCLNFAPHKQCNPIIAYFAKYMDL